MLKMNKIEIQIETLTGQNIPIIAYLDDTVLGLKTKILLKQNVPVSHQHLIWNSCALEDDKTLKEMGIQDGSIVKLVLHLKGGPMYTRKLTFYKEAANFLKKSTNLETLLNDSYFDHYYNGKSCESLNKKNSSCITKVEKISVNEEKENRVDKKLDPKEFHNKAISKKYSLPPSKVTFHKSNTLSGPLKYYNFSLNESFIRAYGNSTSYINGFETQPYLKFKDSFGSTSTVFDKNQPNALKNNCKIFIPVTGMPPKLNNISVKLLCSYSEEDNLEDEEDDSGSSDENGPKSRDASSGKKARENLLTMNKMKALRLQMENLKQNRKPKRKHPPSSHTWCKPSVACCNSSTPNFPASQHSSYHPSYAALVPYKKSGPLYSFTLEGTPLFNTKPGGPYVHQQVYNQKYGAFNNYTAHAAYNSRASYQSTTAARHPAASARTSLLVAPTPGVATTSVEALNPRIRLKAAAHAPIVRCDSTTDGDEFEYTSSSISSCKEEDEEQLVVPVVYAAPIARGDSTSAGDYFNANLDANGLGIVYHAPDGDGRDESTPVLDRERGADPTPKVVDINEYASSVIQNVCADIKGNLKASSYLKAKGWLSPGYTAHHSLSPKDYYVPVKFLGHQKAHHNPYLEAATALMSRRLADFKAQASTPGISPKFAYNSHGSSDFKGVSVSGNSSGNEATTTANSCCCSTVPSGDSGSASSTLSSTSDDESCFKGNIISIKSKYGPCRQYGGEAADIKTLKETSGQAPPRKPTRSFKETAYISDADSEATTHHLEDDGPGCFTSGQTPRFRKKNFVNRCFTCGKKIGIATSFTCRCNKGFCPVHRYPETHACPIDYKSEGRRLMELAALDSATPVQKLHNL